MNGCTLMGTNNPPSPRWDLALSQGAMQGLACVNIRSYIRSRHAKVQRGVNLLAWTLLVRENAACMRGFVAMRRVSQPLQQERQRSTACSLGWGARAWGWEIMGTGAPLVLRSAIPKKVLHILA